MITLKKLLALSFVMLLLLTTNCSLIKELQYTEEAVADFHTKLNEGNFDEIYEQASSSFRNSLDKKEVVRLLTKVRQKLGKVQSTSRQKFHIDKSSALIITLTTVTVSYKTEFSNRTAEEKFVFFIDGKKAKLLSYNVD